MTDLVDMEVGMTADKTVGLSFYSTSDKTHQPIRHYKVRYNQAHMVKSWQALLSLHHEVPHRAPTPSATFAPESATHMKMTSRDGPKQESN